jgi:HAD superfamily hydrolase (TIGR01549 family)
MLKRNAQGPDVLELQNLLKHLGLDITADSNFGVETEAAVRIFQKRRGLTVDGIVGPKTITEIKSGKFTSVTKPIKVNLQVPYFTQRDNLIAPGGTCNVTCLAMTMAYLGFKHESLEQLEDYLSKELATDKAIKEFERSFAWAKKQKLNPRNIHGMLLWLAHQKGFKTRFTTTITLLELEDFLRNYGPVILSGKFTGSGHIVLLTGLTANDDFIIHDPYGNWNTGYVDHDGRSCIYSLDSMNSILRGDTTAGKKGYMADLIWK